MPAQQQQPVWKICLGQLGPNLAEAEEIAGLLQEVSSSIQVTGLTRTLTARTSTSSGNRTHSTRERLKRAVPLDIDAGCVPWSELVAVVSSAQLQEPSSPAAACRQPQVLEVNSGGAVFFLFFSLKPEQHKQQPEKQPEKQQQLPQPPQPPRPPQPEKQQQHKQQASLLHTAHKQQQQHVLGLPLLQQTRRQEEGVAVLKVGASRLAMQAEQFANELTRHLGIAAPDCRIVRQVGSSASEFAAAQAAVQQLADPPLPGTAPPLAAASAAATVQAQGAAPPSEQPGSSAGGCQAACELLAELQHLPCFLLMEFVDGSKLSDCPNALDPAAADVGELCEDVGRLFLLDMLLGNADRMSCSELGWRGNPHNLLYALPGCRHAGRAVAIDSCVARRPPALKASAEDAAVERLSQLVLAVPEVSMALLQQLLGGLRQQQQQQQSQQRQQQSLPGAAGLCSQLSIESWRASSCGSGQAQGVAVGGGGSAAAHVDTQKQQQQQPRDASGPGSEEAAARFTQEEVARFQAGLRHSLDGVLQIKGLLEMVSTKIAEWIAAFVEDLVRLNPALLPTAQNPASSPSPVAALRSPRPSPRPSGRGSFSSIRLEPSSHAQPNSSSSSSSVGGVPADPAAAGAAGAASGGGASSSFSSRLQAAVAAGAGKAGPMQSDSAPPPEQQPASAAGTGAGPQPAVSSSLTAAGADTPEAATPAVTTPVVSRLAAIKAAICSPKHSSSASSSHACEEAVAVGPSDSCTVGGGDSSSSTTAAAAATPCSPPPSSCVRSHSGGHPALAGHRLLSLNNDTPAAAARPSTSELATAVVAAALSPRANAVHTEALVGLFGARSASGRLLQRSLNGSGVGAAAAAAASLGGSAGGAGEWPDGAAGLGLRAAAGGSCGGGGGSGGSAGLRPPCVRRMTWCAADDPVVLDFGASEGQNASTLSLSLSSSSNGRLEAGSSGSGSVTGGAGGVVCKAAAGGRAPTLQPAPLVSSSGGSNSITTSSSSAALGDAISAPPAGWCSGPAAAVTPPAARSMLHAGIAIGGSSSSTTSGGPTRNSGGLSSHALPAFSPPLPAGCHFDSFLQRQHNSRHLSFTSGGGTGGGVVGGSNGGGGDGSGSHTNSPAAGMQQHQQQQQRSSTSSLQVLASLQLDATLASINAEARHDGALAERLQQWKARFREKGDKLSAAIAEWQQRHQLAAVVSTGFLDGTHPIVDAYELGVRLQHMLRRLTALAAGALVQVPIAVLPGVFLGNTVAADSHHLLQYLGVTHVLNAAQELQLTPDPGLFQVLRVAIRDEEEEDVGAHFELARRFIECALASGGSVLVHCHEGKSRSVTLLLAYLMMQQGLSLAAALEHMRAVHPKASPNAGFVAQLMRLDQQLHGRCSIRAADLPRAKPEARICSICGAAAGVSYASLVRHTKAKHGLAKPPPAPTTTAV